MSILRPSEEAVDRLRHELEVRERIVMVMGVTASWVGIAIILMGAPDFLEDWFSPWSRYVLGGWAFVAGLLASSGLILGDCHRRGWLYQVIGLSMMVVWQLTMAACYVGRVLDQGIFLARPGQPLNEGVTGRGYVPFLYIGLTLGTLVPLIAMIRNGRPTRSADSTDSPEVQPPCDHPSEPGTGPCPALGSSCPCAPQQP
jgi:hypothetical protein